MDNNIKLIITDDAAEFSQENLKVLQDFNISASFCAKDGDELLKQIFHEVSEQSGVPGMDGARIPGSFIKIDKLIICRDFRHISSVSSFFFFRMG